MSDPVIERVRHALGRTQPLTSLPVPPALDEAVARLVLSTDALTDVFTRQARAAAMSVESVSAADLASRARRDGITYATLRRAKSLIGARSQRRDFAPGPDNPWLWSLPEHPAPSPHAPDPSPKVLKAA